MSSLISQSDAGTNFFLTPFTPLELFEDMKRFLLSLSLCLAIAVGHAQYMTIFSSDAGLTNTSVRSLYQDSYRNVWVATRNGLNRWDGAKMNLYYHRKGDKYSLLHNEVTCMLEWSRGKVLIGTDRGFSMYDYATNTFSPVPIIAENGKDTVTARVVDLSIIDGEIRACLYGLPIYKFKESKEGNVIAVHTDGEYDSRNNHKVCVEQNNDKTVWAIDVAGNISMGNKKRWKEIKGVKNAYRICFGKNGTVYASSRQGGVLYRYNKRSGMFEKVPVDIPRISNLHFLMVIKNIRYNGDGGILICTDGYGMYMYDERTGTVSDHIIRTIDNDFSTSNLEDVLVDDEGNLWAAIYWRGVIVEQKRAGAFTNIGRRNPMCNTIGTTCVTAICPSKNGKMWVGVGNEGLYQITLDGRESVHYTSSTNSNVPATITAICEGADGKVWLGSSISGVVCYNPQSGTFTPLGSMYTDGDQVRFVYRIVEDAYHNIWFTTLGNGIFRCSPGSNTIEHFVPHTDGRNEIDKKYKTLDNPWVVSATAHGNKLYIGTADGMEIQTITADGMMKDAVVAFRGTNVRDIRVAKDKTVWAATSDGLYHVDAKGQVLKHYDTNSGMSSDAANSIQIDDNTGNLWISTDHGLDCMIHDTEKFVCYYYSDGLQGNEFREGASAKVGDVMYFGGINGMSYFRPSDIAQTKKSEKLDLRIVDFYLNGEPQYKGSTSGGYEVLREWIQDAKEVHLCYKDGNFALQLSTMSMQVMRVEYEYSLNGNGWVSAGEGQNRVAFSNMSPGTYNIRLRARSGNRVSEERMIKVVIHNPWWMSPFAHVLYTIILFFAIYAAFHYFQQRAMTRRMMRQHKQEEEINEARIQFFMNISHEIRTPMTLIIAPLDKLISEDLNPERQHIYNIIRRNADRILQLVNQMMDVRKIEKGEYKLVKSNVEVVAFVRNLHELFMSVAQRRNITFNLNSSSEQIHAMVDAHALDKIVMNLVGNAFKFTPDDGQIDIDIKEDAENVTVSVADSGIGIPVSDRQKVFRRFYSGQHQNGYVGTGIGLNLTSLLVKLHGGDIKVNDGLEGKGSTFVFSLPKGDTDTNAENTTATMTDSQHKATVMTFTPVHTQNAREENDTGIEGRRVVLVEDDADIREYVHFELADDFDIHECSNGKEGWDYVQAHADAIDLVISDIMMPVMEGTELCKHIKNNFATAQIPVILLSAKGSDADKNEGNKLGANAYLSKPFNVEELRTLAKSIIEK